MSDANVISKLIDEAGTRMIYLEYVKKSGEKGSGVFHPKALKHLRGGEDSTAHLTYKSLYNVSKKRWSKVDMAKVTKLKFNGRSYAF